MSDKVILISLRDNQKFRIERQHLKRTGEFFTQDEFSLVESIEIDTHGYILKSVLDYLSDGAVPENAYFAECVVDVFEVLDMKKTLELFKRDLNEHLRNIDKQQEEAKCLPARSMNESEELKRKTVKNLANIEKNLNSNRPQNVIIPKNSSSAQTEKTLLVLGGSYVCLLLNEIRSYNEHKKIIMYNNDSPWFENILWEDSRSYFGLTQIGENLMYAGGLKYNLCQNDAKLCTVTANEPIKILSTSYMQEARCNFSLVTLGDFVYAVGGVDANGEPLKSVERWDPLTNTWSYVKLMPEAKSGSCAAVIDDRIYVVGVNNLVYYDPKLNTWKLVAKLETDLIGCSVVAYNGCIYMIGGREPTKSFHCYYTRMNSWGQGPELPSDIYDDFILTLYENQLFIIGGEYKDLKIEENYNKSRRVYHYDFTERTWTALPELPYDIVGAGAIVISN